MNRLPFAYRQPGWTLAADGPDAFIAGRAPDNAPDNANFYPGDDQMRDDPAYARMCWTAQALFHGALALIALLPALWLACRLLARFPALADALASLGVWAAISVLAGGVWAIAFALGRRR
ncbi:hypothetical protein [Novosphingobium humi]|uniref:Superinfection immunity protein n=1 Tax=Novosphingobium humi TaxID=2282397 RepID=A0ABY7TRW1_9SPHN|nr:hypothetical protein [Novosphingobium humi]WCT75928.1 hypothetical protein PQ457_08090 [Novosphingobium humi]